LLQHYLLEVIFLTMAGRGGRGRATCGGRAGRGPGGGRGSSYSGVKSKLTKVGLCKDLEANIFDFGTTSAADQMRITQEKIAQYIRTKYREDIANKLQNKLRVVIPAPAYTPSTLTRLALRIALVRRQKMTLKTARLASRSSLEAEISNNPTD
jgi:hypothetical protein